MFIVVAGNVADGFTHYGPFQLAENANQWADRELDNCGSDWVVVDLETTENNYVRRLTAAAERILDDWADTYADEDEPISGADMVEYVGNWIASVGEWD